MWSKDNTKATDQRLLPQSYKFNVESNAKAISVFLFTVV